ncbi:hypothetical protein B484DRAFT_402778 [Ochromonadaceae sp. CCMP2298]|nr:hypothetical protein B484DRAFT_402778 [Ochromonadaceae sp. CCMP2298]
MSDSNVVRNFRAALMLLTMMLLSSANCFYLLMRSHRGHSGYEPRGIVKGSPAAKAQSMEAKAHGGAVPKGGVTAALQSGSSGNTKGSPGAKGMSKEAKEEGGGVPKMRKGGVTATIQSIGDAGYIKPAALEALKGTGNNSTKGN